jgi:hypothetical protein
MRRHVLVAAALFLIAGLTLLWVLRPGQGGGSSGPSSGSPPAPPVYVLDRAPQEVSHPESPKAVPSSPASSNGPVDSGLRGFPRVQDSVFYKDWQIPIRFYGKVVDERENPVPEANVHFSWTDTSPGGRSQTNIRSDTNGLFALSGVTGRGLLVDVSKTGYYSSRRDKTDFDYSPNFSLDPHHPDPNSPVVFHLRRRGPGTALITSQYGVSPELEVRAPRNGTTVHVDLLERKVGSYGQLDISQTQPEYLEAKNATAWSFRMAIPAGGFIEQNDEFPFEAPESGYEPVVAFQFNKGETNWASTLKKSYYIAFGQPLRYGWLTVETAMGWGGARLHYAINPEGSRSLEPR